MDERHGSGFDDFSVEMGDFAVKKIKKFDRLVHIGEGGSVDQHPLVHDGKVYFGSMNHNVYCLDARTGGLVWKYKTQDRIGAISSPIIDGGIVYIGSYDYHMYALDAATGKLVWKFPTRGEILSVARVRNGIVYFGSRDHNLYAVTADRGELVWKFRTQDELQSTPELHGDKVLFGSYDHNLYCLDAGSGRLLWKFLTQGEILTDSGLAIHDGIVYCASKDAFIYAVEADTGWCVWKKSVSAYGPAGSIVFHDGLLYLSTHDFFFIALDLVGREQWRLRKNNFTGTPAFHEGRIYLTSEDKNLYCLDMKGREIWKFRTDGAVWWRATVSEDLVYFSSYDCNLYAADSRTGKLAWKFRCSGSPSYMPPGNDEYEVQLSFSKESVEATERERRYNLGGIEDEEGGSTYKSHITYRVSNQYAARGRYQKDADEEGL